MSNIKQPKSISELVELLSSDYIYSIETICDGDDFGFFDSVQLPTNQFKLHVNSEAFFYHHDSILKQMSKVPPIIINGAILVQQTLNKRFRCNVCSELKYNTDISLIKEIQQYAPVKAPFELGITKRSKRQEVVTELHEVFKKENYKNNKQYKKMITKPQKEYNELGIVQKELTTLDIPVVLDFCKRWTDMKLADPKVFKMIIGSGPGKQIEYAINNNKAIKIIGFYYKDILQNICAYGHDEDTVYGIWNVTIRSNEHPRMASMIDVMRMEFFSKNYKFFNRGLDLNKKLRMFKQRYANHSVYFYHYSKL